MALLCGLCSLTFFVMGLLSSFKGGEEGGYAMVMIVVSLIGGGAPALIGTALFWLGRRMRAETPRPTPKSIWPPPVDDAP